MGTIVPLRPAFRRRPSFRQQAASVLFSFRRLRSTAGFFALAGLLIAAYLSWPWPGSQDFRPANSARVGTQEIRTASSARASVIDGDTLHMGVERIRLLGIDAPELSQTCGDEAARKWTCGREARERLIALVGRGEVNCAISSRDQYRRMLATCSAGPVADIGKALVREGYAVVYGRGPASYPSAEAEARAARRGIWRGDFERPQDWRRRNPREN
jgi:endonuclease YncB( thermonuclease family)